MESNDGAEVEWRLMIPVLAQRAASDLSLWIILNRIDPDIIAMKDYKQQSTEAQVWALVHYAP